MAIPVKGIERDFLIKVLYDEEIPVLYSASGETAGDITANDGFILRLEEPAKTGMVFRADRPIMALRDKDRLELQFSYRGSVISFTVEAARVTEGLIVCNMPELLYKDIDPSSVSVSPPPDMRIQFTCSENTDYGTIIEISASGLLFSCPRPGTAPALPPGSELTVKLITPQRSVTTAAKIVRRFSDASTECFGCSFIDIVPEDIRFLFEYIYGKPYTGTEAILYW